MNEGLRTCGKPSRGRYAQGCRCYMCRVANADYERERMAHKGRRGAMVSYTSTRRARKRVQEWLDAGYSLRGISRATGVGRTQLRTLLTGEHPNAKRYSSGKPHASHRMSRKNYEAIMRCEDPAAPASGTIVDAAALNATLAWLYGHGATPALVSRESGIPLGTIYALGEKGTCTYRTHARLRDAVARLVADARARV